MQVANDVTSTNELPTREARPAGALTTPPLPESCRAASSARIASRALWSVVLLAESAVFVAYEASSAASALAPWSAVMLASRLAGCAATMARPSRAFAILVSTGHACFQFRTPRGQPPKNGWCLFPVRGTSKAQVPLVLSSITFLPGIGGFDT